MIICTIIAVIVSNTYIVSGNENEQLSKEQIISLIAECQSIKDNAHTMAESARNLGWSDDSKLIKDLKEKWYEADKQQKEYQQLLNDIYAKEAQEEADRIAAEQAEKEAEKIRIAKQQAAEEEKWAKKSAEYPAATYIWRYMKNLGWNDYVCAGIMGNLMAEVGGQTLNIRYTLSSNGYYGMCQWKREYSNIWGAGLESQCDYLRDTIEYEFNTFGFKYKQNFNFNSFLNMTDAQQAALAFAKSYERCASGSYKVRQQNAVKAYNYFVG